MRSEHDPFPPQHLTARALARAVGAAKWKAEQANVKAALVLIERDAAAMVAEYLSRVTPSEVEAIADKVRLIKLPNV